MPPCRSKAWAETVGARRLVVRAFLQCDRRYLARVKTDGRKNKRSILGTEHVADKDIPDNRAGRTALSEETDDPRAGALTPSKRGRQGTQAGHPSAFEGSSHLPDGDDDLESSCTVSGEGEDETALSASTQEDPSDSDWGSGPDDSSDRQPVAKRSRKLSTHATKPASRQRQRQKGRGRMTTVLDRRRSSFSNAATPSGTTSAGHRTCSKGKESQASSSPALSAQDRPVQLTPSGVHYARNKSLSPPPLPIPDSDGHLQHPNRAVSPQNNDPFLIVFRKGAAGQGDMSRPCGSTSSPLSQKTYLHHRRGEEHPDDTTRSSDNSGSFSGGPVPLHHARPSDLIKNKMTITDLHPTKPPRTLTRGTGESTHSGTTTARASGCSTSVLTGPALNSGDGSRTQSQDPVQDTTSNVQAGNDSVHMIESAVLPQSSFRKGSEPSAIDRSGEGRSFGISSRRCAIDVIEQLS